MSTASEPSGALFPLRLSDFEFYMLSDDRPAWPMVLLMRGRVRGRLLREPFESALQDVLNAQPLLHCRVRRIRRLGWCWEPVSEADRGRLSRMVLDWRETDELTANGFVPSVRRMDLRRECGVFVDVRASESSATVVVHLHHACCDGLGAVHVVGELFARYGRQTAAAGEPVAEFTECNPEILARRESFSSAEGYSNRRPRSLKQTLGKLFRMMLRKPGRLAGSSPRPAATNVTESAAMESRTLPVSAVRALRRSAAAAGCSLNDLLIGELLLQVREWNRAAGRPFGRRWIRLAIPLSMRTGMHAGIPACNLVSYSLVTRRESACDDRAALRQSIHRQTSDALIYREGLIALKLFRWLRRVPGAMWLFLTMKPCLGTVVLTNAGDLTRRFEGRFPQDNGRWIAGNVIVDDLHGVAPVRPNTRAAVTVTEYAATLTISLRTDAAELTAADSTRFLEGFVSRLTALVGESADAC